jgi:hypothetical protein
MGFKSAFKGLRETRYYNYEWIHLAQDRGFCCFCGHEKKCWVLQNAEEFLDHCATVRFSTQILWHEFK